MPRATLKPSDASLEASSGPLEVIAETCEFLRRLNRRYWQGDSPRAITEESPHQFLLEALDETERDFAGLNIFTRRLRESMGGRQTSAWITTHFFDGKSDLAKATPAETAAALESLHADLAARSRHCSGKKVPWPAAFLGEETPDLSGAAIGNAVRESREREWRKKEKTLENGSASKRRFRPRTPDTPWTAGVPLSFARVATAPPARAHPAYSTQLEWRSLIS